MKKIMRSSVLDLTIGIAAFFLLFLVIKFLNPDGLMLVFWIALIYLIAGTIAGLRISTPHWLQAILISLFAFLYIPLTGDNYTMINIPFPGAAFILSFGGLFIGRKWNSLSNSQRGAAILTSLLLLVLLPTTIMPPYFNFWETYARGKAPDFVFQTFDNKTVSSTDLNGKVILLDFWDTHCGPCVKLMPEMEQFYGRYKDDPRVAILVVNAGWESLENAQSFVDRNSFQLPFAYDDNSNAGRRMHVYTLPTTIIIDQNFQYSWKHVGYDEEIETDYFKVLEKRINNLLASAG